MSQRSILWVLPLLTGAGAYMLTPRSSSATANPGDRSRSDRKSYPIVHMADFEAAIHEIEKAPERNSKGLTDTQLREQIVRLKDKLAAADAEDWEHTKILSRNLGEMVRRLGENGSVHLDWMRENHPDGLSIFVGSWADKDPSAVLGYIASFSGPAPCAPETLMKVLNRLGTEHPEFFLEKVKSTPWEKFLFSNDPFGRGLRIEKPGEVNLWVESGAAQTLMDQGVQINGLFWYWAQKDSAAAMRLWSKSGDPRSDASIAAIHEILKAQLKNPEKTMALNESLSQLDETSLSRMRISWTTLQQRRPWAADEIRKAIPLLESWSSPVADPSMQ